MSVHDLSVSVFDPHFFSSDSLTSILSSSGCKELIKFVGQGQNLSHIILNHVVGNTRGRSRFNATTSDSQLRQMVACTLKRPNALCIQGESKIFFAVFDSGIGFSKSNEECFVLKVVIRGWTLRTAFPVLSIS